MKSTLRSIMFIAAAAVTFSACNVEPIETPEESIGTHKVTFLATQDDTKTTMDINDGVASFSWEEADVNFFHIFENEYSYKAKDVGGVIGEDRAMQIIATFENGGSTPFTYFGFFAPTYFNYPLVPTAQTDNGKYDPKADILIAKPVTVDESQSGKAISFQFKRVVAINVMTLKGLTPGETVSEVTIASDKPIAGKYDYTKSEWYNSTDTQITVNASSQANSAGEAVVYFVSAPVDEAMLTITATTTDNKTYSKALAKAITFSEGGVKKFSVTVAASGSHVATFSVNGQATNAIVAEGLSIPFPAEVVAPYGKVFMGWSKVAIEEPQDNVPDMVNTSEEIMGTSDVKYYAVFATESGSEEEELTQTLLYDTWTYSGTTANKNTYRLFGSGAYVESDKFDLSKLAKVIVYGGTYGGDSYNKLSIEDANSNVWKSVTVSGKSEVGENEYDSTNSTPLSGTGKLRIISKSGSGDGASSGSGVRISKIEIYVQGEVAYSGYCTTVASLSSIAIKTSPTKVTYTEGEKFNPSGLVITRKYDNNTSDEYTYAGHESEFTFNPSTDTELSASNTSVTITYNGMSVDQTITVNDVPALIYTISFKDSGKTTDGSQNKTDKAEIISIGGDYIASLSATKVYQAKSGFGIKLGSSGDKGSLTLNWNSSYAIKPVKVKLEIAMFDAKQKVNVSINGGSSVQLSPDTEFSVYEVEMNGSTTLSSIKLESVNKSSNRFYLKSITVTNKE